MKKDLTLITALFISIILLAANAFADIPAPPVNQLLGMPDGIYNNLVEANCRACHDQPGPGNSMSTSARHHLLYETPIIYGECSVNGNTCLTDTDCAPLICETYGTVCSDDTDCNVQNKETCGEVCVGETAASNPLADTSSYVCLSCHDQVTVGDEVNFLIERDCLECHYQVLGEASVHHLTGTAQGTDSPLGDPTRGDCTPCHGTLVDDFGDDADIPTYNPTEQTPSVKNGKGEPFNSEGNGAGACNYCHTSGTGSNEPGTDTESGILVYNSGTLHHSSGVYRSRTGAINSNNCSLCHGDGHIVNDIRNCEQCHGYESLHNIQADSNGDGEIFIGEEDNGFGHFGTGYSGPGRDCWGCHGFSFNSASAAPGSGLISPYLSSSDKQIIKNRLWTKITLIGSSLTNYSGTTKYESMFTLISQDGSILVLEPDLITSSSATVTIPGLQLSAGNYKLRAIKGSGLTWVESNPLPIIIKEPVTILSKFVEPSCGECSGEMTILGSGFGIAPPEGSEAFMNVMQNNVPLHITSWNDSVIKTTGAACDGSEITVNSLFGSATK